MSPSVPISGQALDDHSKVWGSFLVCRDLHYGFQAGTSVNVRCGVEQYLPSLLAWQFGLAQKIPVPPFWSFNKNFYALVFNREDGCTRKARGNTSKGLTTNGCG